MKRFKNILFFADRQYGLSDALDKAVALSRTNNARLTVMDVTPEAGLADIVERTYAIDINKQLREQRLQELEALTLPIIESGVPVLTKVVSGTAFVEVIRAVLRNGHDLLIKVAENQSGFSPWLFGSTDMHLLRKCPCPVWINRLEATSSYRHILAAVNPFDDTSQDLPRMIMDLATSLAEREHATLDVLHVWEILGESLLSQGRSRIPREEFEQLMEHTEKRHRLELDSLLSHYGLSTDSANVHIIKGKPSEIISGAVIKMHSDLIVMGTIGRTGIPGMFIGNTAEDVLRSTRTAVLTVKPRGFVSPVT